MRITEDMRVFEWGSGNSTRWWASRVAEIKAVEHDIDWFRKVKKSLSPEVTLNLQINMPDYVRSIETKNDSLWDIVVIDGEERNACAQLAAKFTNPSGIVIFDNTDCPEHREGILYLMKAGWKRLDFFGLIPSYCYKSCTSVFYQDGKWVKCNTLPCDSQSIL